jgi:hypothetical protein
VSSCSAALSALVQAGRIGAAPTSAAAEAAAAAAAPWLYATLSGARHLVLLAPQGATLPASLAVTLGGVPCAVNWVAGGAASITTPTLAQLCGAGSSDCGVVPLVLYTARPLAPSPPVPQDLLPGLYPPAPYPPLLPASAPVVASDASSALVRSLLTLPQQQLQPYALALAPPATGIRAAAACADPAYASPEQCSALLAAAPDEPAAAGARQLPVGTTCAWGAGEACVPCPPGAQCPGGAVLLPLPGYWVPSPGAPPSDLLACPPPESTVRCPGWGALSAASVSSAGGSRGSASTALCGAGYRGSSCAACAPAHFSRAGACVPCPVFSSPAAAIALPLAQFVGGLAALGLAALLLAHSARRQWGGQCSGSASAVLALLVFVWEVAQSAAAMFALVQGAAPGALYPLFGALTALQFKGVTLPAACLPGVGGWLQFQGFWVSLGVAGVGLAMLALGAALQGGSCGSSRPRRRHPLDAQQAGHCAAAETAAEAQAAAPLPGSRLWTRPARSSWQLRGSMRSPPLAPTPAAATATAAAAAAPPNLLLRASSKLLDLGFGAIVAQFGSAVACTPPLPTTLRAYLEMRGADGSSSSPLLPNALPLEALLRAASDPLYAVQANLTALMDGTVMPVSSLSSDPFQVCREGAHALVWKTAWAAMAVFSLGYPLLLGALLWEAPGSASGSSGSPLRRALADGDMQAPGRAWHKPAGMAVVAILSLTSAFASSAASAGAYYAAQAAAASACLALAGLHLACSPYLPRQAWRGRVTAALHGLAAVAAAVACPLFVPPALASAASSGAAAAPALPAAAAWALGVLPLTLGLAVLLLLLRSWWWALLLEDPRAMERAGGSAMGKSGGGAGA